MKKSPTRKPLTWGMLARRVLLSLLVVGGAGTFAGMGAYSAFTATTTNTGNTFAAGTVDVSQHSGATTLYSGSNKKPGDQTISCVRVTYTGSLTAAVKLYVSAGITNGSLFHLKIERGSGLTSPDNTMNCTGFTSSSTPFDNNLDQLATTYAAGIDGKAAAATWATNNSVDYRFTVTVNDDTTPNAHTSALGTGTHTFTWEARNS
jgi:hypothetical protein